MHVLRWLRQYSSDAGAREWLSKLEAKTVPSKLFVATYDRSSGSGGQNVNKVNSKCTLTLSNFSSCSWFPEEIRRQLLQKRFRYYAPKKDALVIQSDETRSREQNRRNCLDKLVKEVRNSVHFVSETDASTKQKWSDFKRRANDDRLKDKKFHASKKKSRSSKFEY